MTRLARGAALSPAGCACVVFLAACGGAATPPPRAEAPGAAPEAKVAGIELVRPGPKLAVAASGVTAPDGSATPSVRRPFFGPREPRVQVRPAPFRVDDLPLAVIPGPLSPLDAPVAGASGKDAEELFVDRNAGGTLSPFAPGGASLLLRVSLRGLPLARLRIGMSEATVTEGGGGGIYVACRVPERSAQRFVPARWESLSGAPGGVRITVVDAWFDSHECKATVVRRTSFKAEPLAEGILFGYREPCAKCAQGEMITVIGPHSQNIAVVGIGGEASAATGAWSRVTLPVRRGGGGSFVARYPVGILKSWQASLGRSGAVDRDVVAGVDIAQSVDDAEPVAIAYASESKGVPAVVSAGPFRPSIPVPGAAPLTPPKARQPLVFGR